MKKIAIFGGSFNPPHVGHVNAAVTVSKKLGIKKIYVVPTSQNPLKVPVEGASPEQRLEMAKKAFESYGDQFLVDDQEIIRGGKSYSVDTVMNYRKKYDPEEMHLIIGLDAFETLGSWKDFAKLIQETNFVVVTRPGSHLPESIEELPEALRPFVKEFDFNYIELASGRNIQFLGIPDIDISGTELRKRIRANRNLEKFLPLGVESYIKAEKLYQPLGSRVGDYETFTRYCADFLNSKKAIMVKAFDLRDLSAPSEYTIVTSGTSTRHSASLAENLIMAVKEEFGVYPQSLEGAEEGRWVLVDYGNLIVHVFYDFVRQEYRLEDLWKKGKELDLSKK